MKNEFRLNKKDMIALNSKLEKLYKIDKKEASKSIRLFALKSEGDIVRDAPADTGNLRKQVHIKINKKEALVESIALGEDNFDYAVVQEFGSRFRKPKPYFYPNIYRNLKLLTNRINRKIKESLK